MSKPSFTQDAVTELRASFDRQGLMRHFGARLESIEDGRAVIVLPFSENLTQQHGYFHAGASGAIADTAGGYAAQTRAPAGSGVLTVEYKINLIAPAQGDHLEAIGTVLRSGRTLVICQLEVFALSGAQRKQVAVGQQTIMIVSRAET